MRDLSLPLLFQPKRLPELRTGPLLLTFPPLPRPEFAFLVLLLAGGALDLLALPLPPPCPALPLRPAFPVLPLPLPFPTLLLPLPFPTLPLPPTFPALPLPPTFPAMPLPPTLRALGMPRE